MSAVLERFLRYVKYDTRADENSQTYPSTSTQLVLLRDLADELRSLGLADATMDDQISHPVKRERMERLLEAVQRRAGERARRFLGREMEVLVEDMPGRLSVALDLVVGAAIAYRDVIRRDRMLSADEIAAFWRALDTPNSPSHRRSDWC